MWAMTTSTRRVMCVILILGQHFTCETKERQEFNQTNRNDNVYEVAPFWNENGTTWPVKSSIGANTISNEIERISIMLEKDESTIIYVRDEEIQEDIANVSNGNTGYLTRENYEYYNSIMKKIKTGLHSVSAVMCFLVILSFPRLRLGNSSKNFIIALNLFELLASVISIGNFTIGSVFGTLHRVSATYILYANTFISISCRRVVYVLNTMMSMQRMIVVVLPFKARTSFNHHVNLFVIASTAFVVFGAHSYIPFTNRVQQISTGKFVIAHSELFTENNELFGGLRYMLIIVFAFVPLLTSLLANVFLVYSLRNHLKKAQELRATPAGSHGQDHQITYMVVSSTLVFTLLSLPANMNYLLETFLPNYGNKKEDKYLFSIITEGFYSLPVLGDITNFMSYIVLSSAFRCYLVTCVSTVLAAVTGCEKGRTNKTVSMPSHIQSTSKTTSSSTIDSSHMLRE